jgi:hypothetical protein
MLTESVPTHMRHILSIEYEYCRVYLHSLALQAVIQRCVENTPQTRAAHTYRPGVNGRDSREDSSKSNGGTIASQVIRKWLKNDGPHIGEIVDGAHNVLRIVSEGLLPDGYLKHCPVRTYFRIISVAVILLKVFSPLLSIPWLRFIIPARPVLIGLPRLSCSVTMRTPSTLHSNS